MKLKYFGKLFFIFIVCRVPSNICSFGVTPNIVFSISFFRALYIFIFYFKKNNAIFEDSSRYFQQRIQYHLFLHKDILR
jgi:hypothetical protein